MNDRASAWPHRLPATRRLHEVLAELAGAVEAAAPLRCPHADRLGICHLDAPCGNRRPAANPGRGACGDVTLGRDGARRTSRGRLA